MEVKPVKREKDEGWEEGKEKEEGLGEEKDAGWEEGKEAGWEEGEYMSMEDVLKYVEIKTEAIEDECRMEAEENEDEDYVVERKPKARKGNYAK